jgi:hypothetical protein
MFLLRPERPFSNDSSEDSAIQSRLEGEYCRCPTGLPENGGEAAGKSTKRGLAFMAGGGKILVLL